MATPAIACASRHRLDRQKLIKASGRHGFPGPVFAGHWGQAAKPARGEPGLDL